MERRSEYYSRCIKNKIWNLTLAFFSEITKFIKFSQTDDLLATVRDKLKTSLKNFLKRAQEGTFIGDISLFHLFIYYIYPRLILDKVQNYKKVIFRVRMYRNVGLSTHHIASAVELLKFRMFYVERPEIWNAT